MGFIKYTVAIVMITLFAIALTTFAFQFASDNSANVNLENDPSYSSLNTDLKSDTSEFYSSTDTAAEATAQATVSTQTEASEGGTQFKVTSWTALSMARKSIAIGWEKIFGQDSGFAVIFTALMSILGFIMLMYIIKAWFGRNPD